MTKKLERVLICGGALIKIWSLRGGANPKEGANPREGANLREGAKPNKYGICSGSIIQSVMERF